MSGQGSGGNVLAALCSFFLPGTGQLFQGRIFAAIMYFLVALLMLIPSMVLFGLPNLIVAIISAVGAANWSPRESSHQRKSFRMSA